MLKRTSGRQNDIILVCDTDKFTLEIFYFITSYTYSQNELYNCKKGIGTRANSLILRLSDNRDKFCYI